MNQSDAQTIGTALADAGFNFAATLPADQLHALQAWISKSQRFQTVAVTNEGEGCAICAGAWLAGKMPVIILETSGILLSTYALMRCHATFGIPTLMLSTYRGGLGDQEWYAAHTGADWYSSTHIDVVGREFDIWIDGVQIMDHGAFLLDRISSPNV